jgi:hypothetical protein
MKMSEHHEHTEFLKHCLRYDDSPEHQAMMEKLTRLQREVRIVKHASWFLGVLIAFATVSLVYPTFLIQNFPYNVQRSIMNFVLALLTGLSISFLAFVTFGIVLYKKLHRQREECRQLLMRLLATRFDIQPQK